MWGRERKVMRQESCSGERQGGARGKGDQGGEEECCLNLEGFAPAWMHSPHVDLVGEEGLRHHAVKQQRGRRRNNWREHSKTNEGREPKGTFLTFYRVAFGSTHPSTQAPHTGRSQ